MKKLNLYKPFKRLGVPYDKYLHFIGGLLASIAANAAIDYADGNSAVLGTLSSSGFWAGKEIVYDKWMKKGTPDWWDWLWSTIGAIVGTAIYWAFRLIFPLR